ncbi:MAG: DUF4397 domain-containing protein [Chitinophagaceae bacterium]|nr:DUF4397 domain-containing protein [Chitinophagaceae bacterium]
MKSFNQLLKLLVLITLFSSCEKDEIKTTPLTSLNIVNAISDGQSVRLGSNTTVIPNNANGQMALVAGSNDLYIWPVEDSTHPYYTSNKFETNEGEVYSLFLTGDTTAVESIILKETIPYRTDSIAGIRFINLSPNSAPLNITLSTSPTTNEVSDLAYKQYTEFKSYPGLYNSTYTFQVRDASTQDPAPPLAEFTFYEWDIPRFANVTLVIRGKVGEEPILGITRVNNDR